MEDFMIPRRSLLLKLLLRNYLCFLSGSLGEVWHETIQKRFWKDEHALINPD